MAPGEDVVVTLDAFLESKPLEKSTQPGECDVRVRTPKQDVLIDLLVFTHGSRIPSRTPSRLSSPSSNYLLDALHCSEPREPRFLHAIKEAASTITALQLIQQENRALSPKERQVLTYLQLTDMRLGYLLNFGAALMKSGITRTVNDLPE